MGFMKFFRKYTNKDIKWFDFIFKNNDGMRTNKLLVVRFLESKKNLNVD